MEIINGIKTESDLNLDNPAINGGIIDDCVIGGSTPAAGSFTTVTATGQIDGDLLNNQIVSKATFDILGLMTDPRFLNLQCEDPGATTMTDVSGQGHDGTYHGYMTSGDRIKKGMGWSVDFDGDDDYVDLGDHNDFSFGDGTNDEAVTFFGVIELVNEGSQTIIGKGDFTSGSELREWRVYFDADEKILLAQYDESVNVTCYRSQDIASSIGCHSYVISSPGDGGATAMNNVKIYVDGSLVSSSATNNASYVAMENLVTPCWIGACRVAGGFPGELIAGDLALIGMDGSEWSAMDVHRFHQLCKGLCGI